VQCLLLLNQECKDVDNGFFVWFDMRDVNWMEFLDAENMGHMCGLKRNGI